MKEKLFFRNSNEARFIDPSLILYVIAYGRYSVFHLSTSVSFCLPMQLGKVSEIIARQLPHTCNDFARVGRSLIINLTYLHNILLLQGKLELLDRNLDKVVLNASEASLKELIDHLDSLININH